MKFEEMIAALTPKREAIDIQGFKFYVRPMTVQEFGEFFYTGKDKQDRNDLMILNCIKNEDGTPVFSKIEQIQGLYTTVRTQLSGAVANSSIMSTKADELEKK